MFRFPIFLVIFIGSQLFLSTHSEDVVESVKIAILEDGSLSPKLVDRILEHIKAEIKHEVTVAEVKILIAKMDAKEVCEDITKHFPSNDKDNPPSPDLILDFTLQEEAMNISKSVVRYLKIPTISISENSRHELDPWHKLAKTEEKYLIQTFSPLQFLRYAALKIIKSKMLDNAFVSVNGKSLNVSQMFQFSCGAKELSEQKFDCMDSIEKSQNFFIGDDYPDNLIDHEKLFSSSKSSNLEKYFSDNYAWYTMSVAESNGKCENCIKDAKIIHISPDFDKLKSNTFSIANGVDRDHKRNIMDLFLYDILMNSIRSIAKLKTLGKWDNFRVSMSNHAEQVDCSESGIYHYNPINSSTPEPNESLEFRNQFLVFLRKTEKNQLGAYTENPSIKVIKPQSLPFKLEYITPNTKELIGTWGPPTYIPTITNSTIWTQHTAWTTLKLGTVIDPPFIVKSKSFNPNNSSDISNFSGLLIDALKKISQDWFFKYDFKIYKNYGNFMNGKWDGVIGGIEKNEIEIGAILAQISNERHQVVDFTFPIKINPKESNNTYGVPGKIGSKSLARISHSLAKLYNQRYLDQLYIMWTEEASCLSSCGPNLLPESRTNQCKELDVSC